MIDPAADGRPSERTMKVVAARDTIAATALAELAATCADEACREALAMAAAELSENIVKYGAPHPDPRAGTLSVSIEDNVARLCATNAVASEDDAHTVTEMVEKLARPACDAAALYRARMGELFDRPTLPRARLGLLRLVFEGGFRLSASFEAPLLQIVAERACPSH